jgi:hypothetical protein
MVCGGDLRRAPWNDESFMSWTSQIQAPPYTHTHTHTHTCRLRCSTFFTKSKNISKYDDIAQLGSGRPRFSSHKVHPVLGPTLLFIQGVQRVKRLGHETDHLSSSSAEVKNACSCTFTSPYVFMAWRTFCQHF